MENIILNDQKIITSNRKLSYPIENEINIQKKKKNFLKKLEREVNLFLLIIII